jgi:hypothetical protein
VIIKVGGKCATKSGVASAGRAISYQGIKAKKTKAKSFTKGVKDEIINCSSL